MSDDHIKSANFLLRFPLECLRKWSLKYQIDVLKVMIDRLVRIHNELVDVQKRLPPIEEDPRADP